MAADLEVLVVDDQPAVCMALQLLFEIHGLRCVTADGPEAALAIARSRRLGLVVQDMNFTEDTTSGEEGVQLFRDLRAIDADLPVLLMTAWTALETAVTLVKEGAADYLAKPWDDAKLLLAVQSLLEARAKRLQTESLPPGAASRSAFAERYDLCGLIYASEEMQQVLSLAVRVAAADVPVLVTGPNGSGKEKIAEIIQANSRRRDGAFVKVNSGALPDTLFETELFGAEAGAYTGAKKRRIGRFETADQGTLFLDEIGNLSLAGQAKLLRVLQTGEFERVGSSVTQKVDVRLISATNVNLPEAIHEKRFREDLYFRLNVIEVKVPPLRTRPDDILPLAEYFLKDLAEGPAPKLSAKARAALLRHPWPGNIRELRNCMQRALLMHQGPIEPTDLGLDAMRFVPSPTAPVLPVASASTSIRGDDPERERLEAALLEANGVVSKAAALLGISRQALYRRMDRHGVVLERRPRR